MEIIEGDSSLILTASVDADDDAWISVEVKCDGFAGHADGCVVGHEWRSFIDQLVVLEADRTGSASLKSVLEEVDLVVHAINRRGHMGVSGVLSFRRTGVDDWPTQQLHFAFEFEPSTLVAFSRAVSAVVGRSDR